MRSKRVQRDQAEIMVFFYLLSLGLYGALFFKIVPQVGPFAMSCSEPKMPKLRLVRSAAAGAKAGFRKYLHHPDSASIAPPSQHNKIVQIPLGAWRTVTVQIPLQRPTYFRTTMSS